jgi:hypothetical protein
LAQLDLKLGILKIERIFRKRLAREPDRLAARPPSGYPASLFYWAFQRTHVQRNTMNIIQKMGGKLANFAKWFAGAISAVIGLSVRIETILKSEKPLEKPFIAGLSTVVADVEALIAASQGALTADGLNFSADSKIYSTFVTLIDDFKKLAPVVEQAIDILEGKPASAAAK